MEALSQQQAARLGQWGEAAGPFLQGGLAFPLPQQLAHLTQPGITRFPPQLLRPASWGLGAGMEEEGGVGCAPAAGPPYARYGPSRAFGQSDRRQRCCESSEYDPVFLMLFIAV